MSNVTPFRRPPKRPAAPQQSGGLGFKTHRGRVVLVHVLTLLCFGLPWVLAFPGSDLITLGFGIAAALLAVVSRNDATPWAATHHQQAIFTLIIAMVSYLVLALPGYLLTPQMMASFASTLAPVFFWATVLITIWAIVRAGVGLVLAILRRPVFNARGLLI
ncbi:MAG: hypothetical protein NVV62_13750 [Terricaulis sp.]|nr:hypothetical protein [Terricaulis sp.]